MSNAKDDNQTASQLFYLARGVWRVTRTLAIIAAVFFAFNVTGYFLVTNDLGIALFTNTPGPAPKWLRIALLAFDGLANVIVLGLAIALSIAFVVLTYKWLLYVGGYKTPRNHQ